MNVTTLIDTAGDALERYRYDAYGAVTVLDAAWSADADNISDWDNRIGYCGYRLAPKPARTDRASCTCGIGRICPRSADGSPAIR